MPLSTKHDIQHKPDSDDDDDEDYVPGADEQGNTFNPNLQKDWQFL